MQYITIKGYEFGIDSGDWYGHEDDRDTAASKLEDALLAMSEADLAALHTELQNEDEPSDDAERMCNAAVMETTKDWLDNNAPWLALHAA